MARVARALPWWGWLLSLVVVAAVFGDPSRERVVLLAGFGGVALVGAALVLAARRSPRRLDVDDWQHAERLCAAWLRSRGCRSVVLTSAGADGGVDVLTEEWAVQVKHTERRVGRPAVQQIIGAALAVERRPAVVSTSGFTAPAIAFAAEHGVALAALDSTGNGHAVNAWADDLGSRRRRFARRRP